MVWTPPDSKYPLFSGYRFEGHGFFRGDMPYDTLKERWVIKGDQFNHDALAFLAGGQPRHVPLSVPVGAPPVGATTREAAQPHTQLPGARDKG